MFRISNFNYIYTLCVVVLCATATTNMTTTIAVTNKVNNPVNATSSKLEAQDHSNHLGNITLTENSTNHNTHTIKFNEMPESANIPKVRKTTKTDVNVTLDDVTLLKNVNNTSNSKDNTNISGIANATSLTAPSTTTTIKPESIMKKVAENVYINVSEPRYNNNNQTDLTVNMPPEGIILTNQSTKNPLSEKVNKNITNSTNNTIINVQPAKSISEAILNKTSVNTNATANATTSTTTTTTTTTTTASTTSTTTTTTTTTSTTTTTTTTPKPKKPLVTYGLEDFPNLDTNLLQQQQQHHQQHNATLSEVEPPKVQPSQEFSGNTFEHGSYYIVPIVSMIFIVPLAIGILVTVYRRFRDCWYTRHYRRMDFLVDGIYND